jgi:DNA ligase (NAD+)
MAIDIFELETQYLKAKEAYYNGEPIMSDEEFDALEEMLKDMDSDVINLVGTTDRNFKHEHLSQMTSLDKSQTHYNADGGIDFKWDEINKFFDKFPADTVFEASCKYDGMAINLIYRKGNIEKAITRGDKLKGKDATRKMLRTIPLTIDSENDVEVRGEAMIPFKIFEKKYLNHPDKKIAKYKNPRNMVAGVVNRDDISEDLLNEIVFMAVEARIHDGDYDFPESTEDFLISNGFNKTYPAFTLRFTRDQFEKVYFDMKYYRENVSKFQLDGFVIKGPESSRKEMGDTGHHPNWAIAIKFPPVPARTKVIKLENRVATSGEQIPRIVMEGVDLDGTTVRHTAGFNWGYIQREGLFPGAEVEIVKSGDIIPIVSKVLKPVYTGTLPTNCICGAPLIMEGIHLNCTNDDCTVKLRKRFIIGVGRYEMKHWGGTTRSNLFEAGFKQIWNIFDSSIFNKETLIATGFFKEGKTLDRLFESLDAIEKVTLPQVIVSLGFDGVGRTAAKQLAKYIRGKEYDFKGLEKKALEGFDDGESKRIKVENLVSVLEKRGIKVEEEIELTDGIGYEMTGSPSASGFKNKKLLEAFLLSKGYVHQGLNKAKILLTDDLNSTSGKMKAAAKNGVEIREYSEFVESLK